MPLPGPGLTLALRMKPSTSLTGRKTKHSLPRDCHAGTETALAVALMIFAVPSTGCTRSEPRDQTATDAATPVGPAIDAGLPVSPAAPITVSPEPTTPVDTDMNDAGWAPIAVDAGVDDDAGVIMRPPADGGSPIPGGTSAAQPQDCEVSPWSPWSPCDDLCNGHQSRTRTVTNPATEEGSCFPLQETRTCAQGPTTQVTTPSTRRTSCPGSHTVMPGCLKRDGHEAPV